MAHVSPTRIGCSATVEPLSTMAEYLVGCEVDQRETSESASRSEATREQAGAERGEGLRTSERRTE